MLSNVFTTCRDKVAQLLSKPFFHDYRTIFVMWVVMCLILALTKSYNSDGNYRIFIGVWYGYCTLCLDAALCRHVFLDAFPQHVPLRIGTQVRFYQIPAAVHLLVL